MLTALLGASLAADVAGDLREEYVRRAAVSPLRARLWWIGAWMGIAAFATVRHLRVAMVDALQLPGGPFGASDWRRAVRSLRHSPWYASALISVIALTMTLATTAFAVVDGVLFKPLPFPDADRLVVVQPGHANRPSRFGMDGASWQDLSTWRAALPDVPMGAITTTAGARLPVGEEVNAPQVRVAEVDEGFLPALGVRPLIGGFLPEHFAITSTDVPRPALVTYESWQADFDGAADIVGRTLVMRRKPAFSMRIVGVLPRGFVSPSQVDVQLFMTTLRPTDPGRAARRQYSQVIARVPQGASIQVVRQRLVAAMVSGPQIPDSRAGSFAGSADAAIFAPFDAAVLVPLSEFLSSNLQAHVALPTFVVALLLLLLGAVNVSGLVAARSQHHARELAVRRALGASGAAVVRWVFAELALVTGIGAAVGLALARPALTVTTILLPAAFNPLKTLAVDWRVSAFVALAALGSACFMTILPARRAMRTASVLGDSHAPIAASVNRTGRVTIALQVTLATTLAIGGALLVGSLVRVWQQDVGFDRDAIALSLQLSRPPTMGGAEDIAALLDRVRAIRGVESAAVMDAPFLSGSTTGGGTEPPPGIKKNNIQDNAITPGFFELTNVRLVSGRYPTAGELSAGTTIAVSEAVARQYWPSVSALGQTLKAGTQTLTVVGVVADARYLTWDRQQGTIYSPYARLAQSGTPTLLVRGRDAADVPIGDVLQAIGATGSAVRAVRVDPVESLLAETIRERRFDAWLFGAFAASALVILSTGLFGLVAMTAAQRTREVGIRMALGATRDGVIRLLVGETMPAVLGGLAAGGLVAAWAARFLKAYLYQLGIYDVRIWLAAAGALLTATLIGAAIPAMRASRVDPVRALRVD